MSKKKTAADLRADLDKIEFECADLKRRHDEIEQAIADNWNADTSDLQTEYAGIDARLKASTRVKERLYIQWRDAFTREQVEIFADGARAAKAQETKAQDLTRQANELQEEVDDLREQASQLMKAYQSWCNQSQAIVEDLQRQGVADVSGFVQAVNDTQVISNLRHWEGGYTKVFLDAQKKSRAV